MANSTKSIPMWFRCELPRAVEQRSHREALREFLHWPITCGFINRQSTVVDSVDSAKINSNEVRMKLELKILIKLNLINSLASNCLSTSIVRRCTHFVVYRTLLFSTNSSILFIGNWRNFINFLINFRPPTGCELATTFADASKQIADQFAVQQYGAFESSKFGEFSSKFASIRNQLETNFIWQLSPYESALQILRRIWWKQHWIF